MLWSIAGIVRIDDKKNPAARQERTAGFAVAMHANQRQFR
jgi:hypothetical protein